MGRERGRRGGGVGERAGVWGGGGKKKGDLEEAMDVIPV